MIKSTAFFVLLTACNAAFGLDPTITVDAEFIDFDQDGASDSKDNCPTVANADQLDTDGDSFGDACDTCPAVASASTHDEDGDLVGDACDRCPGIEDFNDDTDSDDLGDICDPDKDVAGNVRLRFDTFVTTPPDWQASGISWSSLDDAVAPTMSLPAGDGGLANTTLVAAAPWTATIGVASDRPWSLVEQAGIEVKTGGHTLRCVQDCPTSQCRGVVFIDGVVQLSKQPVRPRPFSRLTLRVSANNVLGCYWNDAAVSSLISGPVITAPATFSLISSPALHVTYFELLQ